MNKIEFTINIPLKVVVEVKKHTSTTFGDKFLMPDGTKGHASGDDVVIYFPRDRFNTERYIKATLLNSRSGAETLIPDDRLDLIEIGIENRLDDVKKFIDCIESKEQEENRMKSIKEVKDLVNEL